MKNKFLLISALLGGFALTACAGTSTSEATTSSENSIVENTTEETTTEENTTEEATSSEDLSSESSSESSSEAPVELQMTLQVSKAAEVDGTYKLKIGEEMTVTPVFNDPSRAEEVTYSATEKGLFGESVSTNVTINNGVIKATGKTDNKITLTIKSSVSSLIQTLTINIYVELDNHDSDIKAKLASALTEEEKSLSSASYMSESKTSSDTYDVTILESGVEYTQTNVNGSNTTEYYAYNGMYNGKYHSYKNNLTNNKVETISSKDTAPSSLTLFNVKTNSFNSSMGISAAVKYYYTYYFTMTAYDYASVKLNENSYSIYSKYNTNFGTKTHTELKLDIIFEDTKLVSFEFERNEYDEANYDFDNNTLISGATSKSYTHVSSQLTYGERAKSSTTYNPQEFYFTSYDVVLTDNNNNVGTTFQAGSVLSYDYGTTFTPSTALKDFDKLSFVSSSDTSVINLVDNELKCLAAGTSTLKFTTSNGVEKEVLVTVEGNVNVLTDEQITAILESKEWVYEKSDWSGTTTRRTIAFNNGKGVLSHNDSNNNMVNFDYVVNNGNVVISNITSTDISIYTIISVTLNEEGTELSVKYTAKPAFGTGFQENTNLFK